MLHESLRELIVARGAEVISDADEFRGALDDFLREDEATVGELNLLVDAVRLGAVQRFLSVVEQGADPAAAAQDAGMSLARDRGTDDPSRSRWAVAAIGYAVGKVPAAVVIDLRAGEGTVPTPPPVPAPEPAPELAPEPAPEPASEPTTSEVPFTQPVPVQQPPLAAPVGERRRRGAFAALLAVVLVAVIASGVWWWQSGDDEGDPAAKETDKSSESATSGDTAGPAESGEAIGDDELVVQLEDADGLRLYRVGVETGAATALTKGPQDRNPGLAPDRGSLVTLTGNGKVPMLVDVASGAEQRLFAPTGPCAYADRVAWSPDGSRLATVCTSKSGGSLGLYVADVTDTLPLQPRKVATNAKGTVSWVSDDALVYQQIEGSSSGLWLLDVDVARDAERLTLANGKYNGQPDYSPENGLVLYLVGATRTGVGEVWVMKPDGSERRRLSPQLVAFPVWSADGKRIAFLGGAKADQLRVAKAEDLSAGVPVPIDQPGRPGPPVWGSR